MSYSLVKCSFVLTALVLAVILIIAQILFLLKKNSILSKFVPLTAGILILYVVLSLFEVILIPHAINKVVVLILGLSPFIIGKFVSYKKLIFYSIIQVLCVIFSMLFVLVA